MSETFNLVVVSAGTSDPSSTSLLAMRTAQRVTALAEQRGAALRTRVIDLRELAENELVMFRRDADPRIANFDDERR